MKKLIAILLCMVMVLSFTACGSGGSKKEKIDAMIIAIATDSEYKLDYFGDDYVLESAAEMYSALYDAGDYEAVKRLDDAIYSLFRRSSSDEKKAREFKKNIRIENIKRILSSDNADAFISFVKYYHSTPTDDFFYRENAENDIKAFLDRVAVKPITEDGKGGFYDDKKDNYTNEQSNYYDPLSKEYVSHGEVGTYKSGTAYGFYGDFLVERRYEQWYGNYSKGNSPDKTYYTTYYKNSITIKGESEVNSGYGVDSEEGIDLDNDIYYINEANTLIELSSWELKIFSEGKVYEYYI